MDSEKLDIVKKLVDIEFSEKILRKAENDLSIEVHDIEFTFATKKGDNFASEMFRATIEYTRLNSRKKEKKSIIIKTEPLVEGIQKDLVRFFVI
jgi:hypothetical protein